MDQASSALYRNWEELIHIMICDLGRKVCETVSDQTFHAKCGRTNFNDGRSDPDDPQPLDSRQAAPLRLWKCCRGR